MILKIVGHPRDRMAERSVSVGDIEHAIRHAHTVVPSPPRSITYIGPGLNGADLKVWALPPGYVDEHTTIIIKSTAWRGTP